MGSLFLFIDFSPVPDVEHKDQDSAVVDPCQQPVVADPVAPAPAEIPGQGFAVAAGVVRPLQIFADPPEDQRGGGLLQLFQVLQRFL